MPKLKVGDTFTYTKEMNDAKIQSRCKTDCQSYIGKKVMVLDIDTCNSDDMYLLMGLDKTYFNLCHHVNTIDPYLPNSSLNMNTLEKFALTFKPEPEKSFRKAGITNGDDLLTPDGEKIFMSWLLKKQGAEFKKEVVDPILTEKKSK